MKEVRMGVIGLGNMGSNHIGYINEIPGCRIAAVADHDPEMLARGDKLENCEQFAEGLDLINSGTVDAILIATPHYDHPPLTLAAFKKGIHVLCEKPVAVTAAAADKVNKAFARMKKKPIWGAMFNQRTHANWQFIKRVMDSGEIGELRRVCWIITNWFRSQAYYDSGGWRATWAGEGGGVLINQCPHNLDLITWFCGTPNKVISNVGLGKYHDIEVEDDVTAMLEYPNGATGVFITTTGDSPGTNRLEIVGTKGKIVTLGGGKVELTRSHQDIVEFCYGTEESFGNVACDTMTVQPGGKGGGHRKVTEQFIKAILANDASLLVAHASEGIKGLELGNAMLMSGVLNEPIKIPTPRAKFEKLLKDLAAKSKGRKPKKVRKAKVDMSASF